jgi:phage terminase Nu1 subunit (DNA packaging protein)
MAQTTLEVSTSDLATILGVSSRRVAQLVEEKILIRTARGTFDLGEAVRNYVAYRERRIAARLGAGEMHKARQRYLLARAKNAEIAAEERIGKLVPADQVETSFVAIAGAVRSHLLAIPAKVAARAGMCKTAVEVKALLQAEITEALSELALTKVSIDGQA